MATVNFIRSRGQSRGSLQGVLDYVRQDKKCLSDGVKFITGKDCCAETAYAEFLTTKNSYAKAKGIFYYHYTQSFSPEEEITPAQAHRAALKLAEHYQGFEVLVATHCDADHIHSHLVINSVSFADGKKLHQGPHTLEELRRISDDICSSMGLSTLQPYEQKPQAKTVSSREFRAAEKGESWKFRLMGTIDQAMQTAQTPADFIALMKRRGYGVRWEAGRKSITYTTSEGQKCRDNKLHETKYLKERMEIEFGFRATQAQEQRGYRSPGQGIPSNISPDPAGAVGGYVGPADKQLAIDPSDLGAHGNETIFGGSDQRAAQPSAGDVLTGWEDARAKFQMAQRFGILVEEPSPGEPGEFMEEADLDSDWTEPVSERVTGYPDSDSEMTQWQMTL